MVHHIINGCEDILSLAKHIVPQVMVYENYALSIADLHDAVQPLKKANKGWKKSEVIDTSYSKPIPKELNAKPQTKGEQIPPGLCVQPQERSLQNGNVEIQPFAIQCHRIVHRWQTTLHCPQEGYLHG